MREALAIVLGAALGLLGCASGPPHVRPWVEVRTPNFVILSPMSEAKALGLARDLELFRSVVELMTAEPIPPSRVPLRVYAFEGTGTYRYFERSHVGGYFIPSMRQTAIVLRGMGAVASTREILQHEYVHFLLRNRGHYAYPPWYSEGFAEFLGNVELRRGGVDIGRPQRLRINNLRHVGWVPLEDLLARRNLEGMQNSQIAAFYAESWALVHYLNFGRKKADTRGELTRYLKALRTGATDEKAVRLGFGADTGTLGHRLRKYIETGRFPYITVGFEEFDTAGDPQLRALGSAEIASALGRLSITLEKYEQAQTLYEAALVEHPGDAVALAGLASALAGQERWDDAQARYEEALAAGPDDALVHLDYANYIHARAKGAKHGTERERFAQRARNHYVRSWKLDDSIPETYAEYGATFLLEGQDAARGRQTLEHANRMLPSSREVKINLARLYAKLDRREQARELILVVSAWAHSREDAEEMRALLEEVGGSTLETEAPLGDW